MTRNQENQLSGKYAVLSFRAVYGATVEAGTPALTPILDKFEDLLDATEKHEGEATENRTGHTLDKRSKRNLVEKEGFQIASSYIAYHKTQNQEVEAETLAFTRSELHEMADTEVAVYGKNLIEDTKPYNPAVEPFGTTAQEYGDFATTVNNYKAVVGSPLLEKQIAVANGIEVDKDLAAMEKECSTADLIMENYIDSEPVIYNIWQGIRKTVDYAATHGTPTGTLVLLPNSYTVAFEATYSATRYFRVVNKGGDVIYYGLSTLAASFSNPPRSILGGESSMCLSKTLGANGNILLIHNPNNEEITIDYWVVN